MKLQYLHANGIRNLQDIHLKPHPTLNLFIGPNGSGKTSLLEAIALLGMGRSFRTKDLSTVIAHSQERLICYAEVLDKSKKFALGLEKRTSGALGLQLKGDNGVKLSEFIGNLPVQIITPDSFHLLTAGPDLRRRFIDLGVFHVEQSFLELSFKYRKLLKQRNAALKQNAKPEALKAWDIGLIETAEILTQMRVNYLEAYMPVFFNILGRLLPNITIEFSYFKGWGGHLRFETALEQAFFNDLRWKSTTVGPHRADLKFSVNGYPAQQVLSRGQQKLFICALILAQARYLSDLKDVQSLFLIDDLASELDKHNLALILNWILELNHQVLLTSVEEKIWDDICQGVSHDMFHVKHGEVYLRSSILAE